MAVRFLAFRPDVRFSTVAMYVAPFACILSLIPVVGLYMRVRMPELAQADQAMPVYLQTYLHPALGGFVTLCILFAMQSTANSLLHTVASAASHDLRRALFPRHENAATVLFLNRAAVVVFGALGLVMMLYAPPFLLSWLGILGTGTLLAALVGPVFVASFWCGNGWGALAGMTSGFVVSGAMLLWTNAGWVVGPLTGCLVSSLCYVAVSLATRRTPRPVGQTV
ncbi:hypothetical protein OCGS_0883 [Oceaniovalibus guishaninsula JLT2003]|uniref:Uncharacterized protein n=2 Tax=Oceaniovalibus TaxID=1207070 RepID=K2HBI2_9RHOB|nr:hypothetical protein OCGS_0883 [Oceaniovalibus guishaninsula JLT2003]